MKGRQGEGERGGEDDDEPATSVLLFPLFYSFIFVLWSVLDVGCGDEMGDFQGIGLWPGERRDGGGRQGCRINRELRLVPGCLMDRGERSTRIFTSKLEICL